MHVEEEGKRTAPVVAWSMESRVFGESMVSSDAVRFEGLSTPSYAPLLASSFTTSWARETLGLTGPVDG